MFTPYIKRIIKSALGREIIPLPLPQGRVSVFGNPDAEWAVPKDQLQSTSIIYSFGIGEDASFDLQLIKEVGCTVHAFDPTPRAIEYANTIATPLLKAIPWAIWTSDTQLRMHLPKNDAHVSASLKESANTRNDFFIADCRCLRTIMQSLGHKHIDYLKLDVEGAEYDILDQIVECRDIMLVANLAVEFHHWISPYRLSQTKKAIRALKKCGFKITWTSVTGHEFLFSREQIPRSWSRNDSRRHLKQ